VTGQDTCRTKPSKQQAVAKQAWGLHLTCSAHKKCTSPSENDPWLTLYPPCFSLVSSGWESGNSSLPSLTKCCSESVSRNYLPGLSKWASPLCPSRNAHLLEPLQGAWETPRIQCLRIRAPGLQAFRQQVPWGRAFKTHNLSGACGSHR
jgi:hypothetical protein